MMKFVAVLVVLFGISAGYSIPRHNAYLNYQQPTGYRTIQRSMYGVQFRNQQFRNQRVTDFDAGMHPYDFDNAELPVQDPNVESVADAYPSEPLPVEEESHQDAPVVYEDEVEEPIEDEPSAAPAVPAVASAAAPENKKKTVPARASSGEEENQDAPTGLGSIGSAFFPINFGSASGGSIAIANSHSTGKGGSATSTATAYGSPVTAELRRTSASQLRKRPTKLRNRQ
ncbi:uncharacterized protein LOC109407402 isoform X2 [Aedes albopictus]|uniref:Secreted protein n=1 Tax=Aedes albopictus TaxID=7160 RepID=A0ABM2A312_AEDAL